MMIVSGIALAIPISVVTDFMRNGTGPRLGITVQPVSVGQRGGVGLLVLSVEKGSPAEHASLLMGDVLVGANETLFESPADLADSLREAGKDIVKLRFVRGDHTREREVAISLMDRANREAA